MPLLQSLYASLNYTQDDALSFVISALQACLQTSPVHRAGLILRITIHYFQFRRESTLFHIKSFSPKSSLLIFKYQKQIN